MPTVKTKLPKSVKRITILQADKGQPLGAATQAVVVKRPRQRKKRSKGLVRVWERLARRAAKANAQTAATYKERHERSNRKRRDGWLRDYAYNLIRAGRKGAREFKLTKIFG